VLVVRDRNVVDQNVDTPNARRPQRRRRRRRRVRDIGGERSASPPAPRIAATTRSPRGLSISDDRDLGASAANSLANFLADIAAGAGTTATDP